ncbi:ectoine synthase [Streptosporangium oxazolinicum]|uniref:L-ectoine synthase n=1 Tax=Streptosporangium oxazolinicum TaxID=909287 RepID=A0ABP8AFI5_9ACTN
MIFRDIADAFGTKRDVRNENYHSTRLLLAEDGAGVGLNDVVLNPGVEGAYGYPDRTEIAYCVSGAATVVDLGTGEEHAVVPGVLWVAPPGSKFTLVATEPLRLICVFDPPLEGTETGIIDR